MSKLVQKLLTVGKLFLFWCDRPRFESPVFFTQYFFRLFFLRDRPRFEFCFFSSKFFALVFFENLLMMRQPPLIKKDFYVIGKKRTLNIDPYAKRVSNCDRPNI